MSADRAEPTLKELLSSAGIEVNGSNPQDIQVHNPRFYQRVLNENVLGLGESYMDGWWDCEAIDQMVDLALRADLENRIKGNWKLWRPVLQSKLVNLQSSGRAYQVGEEHYDLGNDLYTAMLDKRMNYTCGYWRDAQDLDAAQEAKLDLVCRKIQLEPGMSVLELGCGFGAFAKFAAEKYGARVTGVTVSRQQVELGMKMSAGLPVELKLQDYRLVEGSYDRVISIGVMEHIGYKNYRTYMDVVNRTLKDDGIAFIHTIGGNFSTTTANPWTTRYIFPNGMLPSIAQLGAAMENQFIMEDWHNFGPYYDNTLMAWYDNFESAWPELKNKYTERFYRMWKFYLLSSAGGFRSRLTQLWQIVMTRPYSAQPDARQR